MKKIGTIAIAILLPLIALAPAHAETFDNALSSYTACKTVTPKKCQSQKSALKKAIDKTSFRHKTTKAKDRKIHANLKTKHKKQTHGNTFKDVVRVADAAAKKARRKYKLK